MKSRGTYSQVNGAQSSDVELASSPAVSQKNRNGLACEGKLTDDTDDCIQTRSNRFGVNTSVSRRSSSAQGR